MRLFPSFFLSALLLSGVFFSETFVLSNFSQASPQVLAVVNDQPITSYDIEQRKVLNAVLNIPSPSREAIFKGLVDAEVLKTEAQRLGISISDDQVDDAIGRMAAGGDKQSKLTSKERGKALLAKLKAKGVSEATFRSYVTSLLLLRGFMAQQTDTVEKPNDREIDQRLKKILQDPRMHPVTLYNIIQVDLPVEGASQSMASQLLYARMVEAQQIAQNYKGCSSLKKAASPIYNVKIAAPVPAVGEKLPPELRKALDQAGTTKLLGPMRGPTGVRLLAFCGKKVMSPPKPDRKMIENLVMNEKYGQLSDNVMRDMRHRAFIDPKTSWARAALK